MTQPPKDSSAVAKLGVLCGAVVGLVALAAVAQAFYGLSRQVFGLILIIGLGAGVVGVGVTAFDFFSSSPRLRALAVFLIAVTLVGGLGWVGGSIAAPTPQLPSGAIARRLSAIFGRLERRRKVAYHELRKASAPGDQVVLAVNLAEAFEGAAAEVRSTQLDRAREKRGLPRAIATVATSYRALGRTLERRSVSRAELDAALARVVAKTTRLTRVQGSLRREGFKLREFQ